MGSGPIIALGSQSRVQSLDVDCLLLDVQQCSNLGLGHILGSVFSVCLTGGGGTRKEGEWG